MTDLPSLEQKRPVHGPQPHYAVARLEITQFVAAVVEKIPKTLQQLRCACLNQTCPARKINKVLDTWITVFFGAGLTSVSVLMLLLLLLTNFFNGSSLSFFSFLMWKCVLSWVNWKFLLLRLLLHCCWVVWTSLVVLDALVGRGPFPFEDAELSCGCCGFCCCWEAAVMFVLWRFAWAWIALLAPEPEPTLTAFLAMSRFLELSVRLVLFEPWQRAFWMFLLLSTRGWMLSRGVRNAKPLLFPLPSPDFFLFALNFFQLRALMNIECFFKFFSKALFSAKRWAFSLLMIISLFFKLFIVS